MDVYNDDNPEHWKRQIPEHPSDSPNPPAKKPRTSILKNPLAILDNNEDQQQAKKKSRRVSFAPTNETRTYQTNAEEWREEPGRSRASWCGTMDSRNSSTEVSFISKPKQSSGSNQTDDPDAINLSFEGTETAGQDNDELYEATIGEGDMSLCMDTLIEEEPTLWPGRNGLSAVLHNLSIDHTEDETLGEGDMSMCADTSVEYEPTFRPGQNTVTAVFQEIAAVTPGLEKAMKSKYESKAVSSEVNESVSMEVSEDIVLDKLDILQDATVTGRAGYVANTTMGEADMSESYVSYDPEPTIRPFTKDLSVVLPSTEAVPDQSATPIAASKCHVQTPERKEILQSAMVDDSPLAPLPVADDDPRPEQVSRVLSALKGSSIKRVNPNQPVEVLATPTSSTALGSQSKISAFMESQKKATTPVKTNLDESTADILSTPYRLAAGGQGMGLLDGTTWSIDADSSHEELEMAGLATLKQVAGHLHLNLILDDPPTPERLPPSARHLDATSMASRIRLLYERLPKAIAYEDYAERVKFLIERLRIQRTELAGRLNTKPGSLLADVLKTSGGNLVQFQQQVTKEMDSQLPRVLAAWESARGLFQSNLAAAIQNKHDEVKSVVAQCGALETGQDMTKCKEYKQRLCKLAALLKEGVSIEEIRRRADTPDQRKEQLQRLEAARVKANEIARKIDQTRQKHFALVNQCEQEQRDAAEAALLYESLERKKAQLKNHLQLHGFAPEQISDDEMVFKFSVSPYLLHVTLAPDGSSSPKGVSRVELVTSSQVDTLLGALVDTIDFQGLFKAVQTTDALPQMLRSTASLLLQARDVHRDLVLAQSFRGAKCLVNENKQGVAVDMVVTWPDPWVAIKISIPKLVAVDPKSKSLDYQVKVLLGNESLERRVRQQVDACLSQQHRLLAMASAMQRFFQSLPPQGDLGGVFAQIEQL